MDMAELNRIAQHGLGGEFRLNEPMREHTSWRAGRRSRVFPTRSERPCAVRAPSRRTNRISVVGLGNSRVRWGCAARSCLHTREERDPCRARRKGCTWYTEAGASPRGARFAAKHGLRGAEFRFVGGALAMNAGCYGTETWGVASVPLRHDRAGRAGLGNFITVVGLRNAGRRKPRPGRAQHGRPCRAPHFPVSGLEQGSPPSASSSPARGPSRSG